MKPIDDIIDKYNNTSHSIIKMKPVGVKSHFGENVKLELDLSNHATKADLRR